MADRESRSRPAQGRSPGGPTDPDAPELYGERKKRDKMEKMGTLPEAGALPESESGANRGEDQDGGEDEPERTG